MTSHLLSVPRLRMSGSIPLLPLCAFMAWTGTTIQNINDALYNHKEIYFGSKMYKLATFTVRFFSKLCFLNNGQINKKEPSCAQSHNYVTLIFLAL